MTHTDFSIKFKGVELNPIVKILREIGSIVQYCSTNPRSQDIIHSQIVQQLCTLFSSENLLKAAIYFAVNEAATALILKHKLKLPHTTAYWALQELHKIDLIKPATTFRDSSKRPITVWAIPGADPEKVKEAILEHRRLTSPKYQIAQQLLTDFTQKKEVSYREIVIRIRELKIPYQTTDIADLIAWELQKRGVRVWR